MKVNSLLLLLLLLTTAAAVGGPISREIPLAFEPAGDSSAPVRFVARAAGHRIFLDDRQVTLYPEDGRGPIRLKFVDENAQNRAVSLSGEDRLPGESHYLRGPDPGQWRTNVPQYRRVRASGIYPGIDVVFYGNLGRLEYDFIVRPGADPSRIAFSIAGPGPAALDAAGDLLLEGPSGDLRHHRPVSYQEVDGRRQPVDARYKLATSGLVRVRVGEYDRHRELIIDPVITLSTFLGGSGLEEPWAVATDAQGNIYLAGGTESSDYPTTPGTGQSQPPMSVFPGDAFLTKLSPDGKSILYSTFLGGRNRDLARAIAVDSQGNAYVAGETESNNFPTTFGAFRVTNPSTGTLAAGFVAKISPDGSSLSYSTYLGTSELDQIYAVAVDGQGNAYVGGSSSSDSFPVTAGAPQSSCPGLGLGGFVTKLNLAGTDLAYSTRLCGSAHDEVLAIAVDSGGNVYAAGVTGSDDFPVTNGSFQAAAGGGDDGFVAKISSDGRTLTWSTYLGGSAADSVQGIAVDGNGDAFVAGVTHSSEFPSTNGAFQQEHADRGSSLDAFVAKLNAAGSALAYATFLGGSRDDNAAAIAVGTDGSALVTGFTESADFPATSSACLTGYRGGRDAFLARLNPAGTELSDSLFLGGGASDSGHGVALGAGGAAIVAGGTNSSNFTTTADAPRSAYANGYGGATDAFITRIDDGPDPTDPCIALNGFLNAASFQPGPLAPGEIVSIFGAGLGPADLVIGELIDDSFPTELAGTRVLISGIPAPVIFTRSDQVNAIVPFSVAGRDTVTLRVEYLGVAAADLELPVAAASPAVFTADRSGSGQAALLNQDYSVNSPDNPAAKGSIVQIFLTGGGVTDPPGADGRLTPSSPLTSLGQSATVTIGGLDAPVHFAGAAPGLVAGAVQINAEVPANVPSGIAIPLIIRIGDAVSPLGVTLAVR